MTKYAKKILEIVESSRSHLTAEEVFVALRQTYPKVALATVYNNLNGFGVRGAFARFLWKVCRITTTALCGTIICSARAAENFWISTWTT